MVGFGRAPKEAPVPATDSDPLSLPCINTETWADTDLLPWAPFPSFLLLREAGG